MQWQPSHIKALRILCQYSQYTLAEIVGVPQSRIGRVETGAVPCSKALGAALHLVRRLNDVGIGDLEKEIEASPYLKRHDKALDIAQ